MGTRDQRVDAYIAKAAPFAQPILAHLRDVVHEGCPDVVETMKWSTPFFDYDGPLCMMAAFKEHCRFGFWKSGLVLDGARLSKSADDEHGPERVTSLADLPPKRTLVRYVKKAAALNAAGVKVARPKRAAKTDVVVPDALAAALAMKAHAKARAAFDAFSPSHRREYAEWIADAKTDATREKRVAQTLEWLAEGKSRNWKYQ